jgi:glycosyltransferase involved in cell wall biosynthesis
VLFVMAEPTIDQLAAEMLAAGTRHVHVLAWRDLDDPDSGGSEVHADHFMRRAAAAGLEITHRTSAAAGVPAEASRNGYRVIRRGSRFTVFPRVVASETIRRMGRFDALVEVWNGVPWMSPVWTRKPHITFLHHVHGPMWDQILPGPLAQLGRVLEARLAPPFYRRGLTLTPSEATRDDLLGLGFRPERVIAVNNGIDEEFSPGGERSSVPLVVSVGRLAEVKGMARLVEAVAADVALRRRANLVIVGGDLDDPTPEEREEIDRIEDVFVRHPEMADGLVMLGHRPHDDVLRVLAAAGAGLGPGIAPGGAYACASRKEEFGLAIVEALASGLPVVAPRAGGPSSYVEDGVTGRLVDTLDTPALAGAIRDALDLAGRPGRRERARSLVAQRFSIGAMSNAFIPIYDAACRTASGLMPAPALA